MFKKISFKGKIDSVVTTTCVWCGNEVPWVGGKPSRCPFCGKLI